MRSIPLVPDSSSGMPSPNATTASLDGAPPPARKGAPPSTSERWRPQLTATYIGRNEGLRSSQTHIVIEGSEGRIWTAGPCGLSAYDGSRVISFDARDGLSSQGLRTLAADHIGQLWIGSDAGVDRLWTDSNGESHVTRVASGGDWPLGPAEHIAVTRSGRVYVGTATGLVFSDITVGATASPESRQSHDSTPGHTREVIKGGLMGKFKPVNCEQLAANVIIDLALAPSGELLALCAPGHAWVMSKGQWRLLSPILYSHVGSVTQIRADTLGRIFIAGTLGLVIVSEGAILMNVPCPLLIKQPISVMLLLNRELWTAESTCLRCYRDSDRDSDRDRDSDSKGGWALISEWTLESGINHLMADSTGNIWCATDAVGCCKISALRDAIVQPILGSAVANYTEKSSSGQVFSVRNTKTNTHDGALLVGAENGVYRVLPAEQSQHEVIRLSNSRVWDVLEQNDGSIMAATHFQGLLHISANNDITHIANHRVLEAPCRTLASIGPTMFVGTLRGLVSIRDSVTEEITGPDGISVGYVYSLVKDESAGNHVNTKLWVCTLGNGLWVYSLHQGLRRVLGNGLTASGNTYAITMGTDLSRGMRVVLQDTRVVMLSDPAPKDAVLSFQPLGYFQSKLLLEVDNAVAGWTAIFSNPQTLAIGDSEGLNEYAFPSMRLLRKIRCGGIGPVGWEFTSSRALALDDAGRYWCGLNSGLTLIDPTALDKSSELPTLHLLDIKWINAVASRHANRFEIPPGKWHATVRFFSSWGIDESDLMFRHRLVGFDEDWSAWTINAEISYSALPPGSYLLEAQASSPLRGTGPVCLLAEINVAATWWSAAGLGGVVQGLESVKSLFSTRLRNEHLLRANRELTESVKQGLSDTSQANRALLEANARLESLLRIDVLTEISNRRAFSETMIREWKRAMRERTLLAVVMIDIDHFKLINDEFGHVHGDTCLKLVAQCLASLVRDEIDSCARYGGEEFVVLAPNKTGAEAMKLAERLCSAVAAMKIPHAKASTIEFVTISCGVASVNPSAISTPDALLKRADQALYVAKWRGRNQAQLYTDSNNEAANMKPDDETFFEDASG